MQQYLTSSNCKPLLRIVPCYMLHSWLKSIEQLLSLSHLFQLKVLLYCKVLEKIVKKLCTYFCVHFSPVSDKWSIFFALKSFCMHKKDNILIYSSSDSSKSLFKSSVTCLITFECICEYIYILLKTFAENSFHLFLEQSENLQPRLPKILFWFSEMFDCRWVRDQFLS